MMAVGWLAVKDDVSICSPEHGGRHRHKPTIHGRRAPRALHPLHERYTFDWRGKLGSGRFLVDHGTQPYQGTDDS